jgi:hypothetical protein
MNDEFLDEKFLDSEITEENYIFDESEIGDIDSDKWMRALPSEHRELLRKEYRDWLKSKKDSKITLDEVTNAIMKDLNLLHVMSVQEYTLYRKWDEIQRKYPRKDKDNVEHSFFAVENTADYPELLKVKENIWVPKNINDYLNLEPEMLLCNDNQELTTTWNILRTFTHTQINNSNIGRNLYFITRDKITKKYLGIINISSDFMDLTPRDNYIGWNKEQKTGKRMINHTAIGSTIIPMQPLGYNYLGGKLMALLTISDFVEKSWNDRYDSTKMPSKLVGMTTTSLYSSFSQYNNLAYWNKRGHSSGSIKFEVSKETLVKVKAYLQREFPLKYWEWYIATEPQGMPLKRDFKQRSLSFIYNKLKIEKEYYETNHSRGIYFCPFYENMKEYLRMEIPEEKLIKRKNFDNSIDAMSKLWKEKYAKKRVDNFQKDNKEFINEVLFYDDVIRMTWEETKEKYLTQVGR